MTNKEPKQPRFWKRFTAWAEFFEDIDGDPNAAQSRHMAAIEGRLAELERRSRSSDQ